MVHWPVSSATLRADHARQNGEARGFSGLDDVVHRDLADGGSPGRGPVRSGADRGFTDRDAVPTAGVRHPAAPPMHCQLTCVDVVEVLGGCGLSTATLRFALFTTLTLSVDPRAGGGRA